MKQARSPSARTEEWTSQRSGNHAFQGMAIALPKGEASTLSKEWQSRFPRSGKWTSRGTATSLPANKYYSI